MKRLHYLRRITQVAFLVFFLLFPVLNILRYDSTTKEFFLFGLQWHLSIPDDAIAHVSRESSLVVAKEFFLKAILPWIGVLSFFPVMGFLFGRFFCGWLCPEGLLFEFADFLNLKILGRRSLYRKKPNDPDIKVKHRLPYILLALLFYITVPPLIGVALSGFFISPAEIKMQILSGSLSKGLRYGIIGVSIYIFITSIFVRHVFCKYICAAGLMQMLFGWISPIGLKVRFHREAFSRCTDCRRCERVCFMDVKPRAAKRNINCVNCGECITACNEELGYQQGLFSFSFGKDENPSSKRYNEIIELNKKTIMR